MDGARERVLDADLHYLQAMRALSREASGEWHKAHNPDYARQQLQREVDCRLHLAQVSATRERAAALERIAAALERRNVPAEGGGEGA